MLRLGLWSLLVFGAAGLACALWLHGDAPSPAATSSAPAAARPTSLELPLVFEENRGQVDAEARFLARAPGATAFLTPTGPVFGFSDGTGFRVRVRGGGPGELVAEAPLEGRVSTFIGNDPKGWHTGLRIFAQVRQKDAAPGVDLVFHGNGRQLEYDLDVAPGVDVSALALEFDGVDSLELGSDGRVRLSVAGHVVEQLRPTVYELVDGVRREVEASYQVVAPRTVAFAVGPHSRAGRLVIDPVVMFATYLGGTGAELTFGAAFGPGGTLFMTGLTSSPNFPTSNSLAGASTGASNVFVAKLNPATGTLAYLAYFAPSGAFTALQPSAIAVDQTTGEAVVVGDTDGSTYPTQSPLQTGYGGGGDGFITKLSAAGDALVFSTFYGLSGSDSVADVELDSSGAVYATGALGSCSGYVGTSGAYQTTSSGSAAFILKLTPTGSSATVATLAGTSALAFGLAVDPAHNIYLGGALNTFVAYPNPDAGFQHGAFGNIDGFAAKFDPTGSTLVWAAQIGGSGGDHVYDIAVDATGAALIGGDCNGACITTVNAPYPSYLGGVQNGFVMRLSPDGNTVTFASYYGGSGQSGVDSVAYDALGGMYLGGFSASSAVPSVNALPQGGRSSNVFVAKLRPGSGPPIFSTPLPGITNCQSHPLAVDAYGHAFFVGAGSAGAIIANAVQPVYDGGWEAYAIELDLGTPTITGSSPAVSSTLGGGTLAIKGWNIDPIDVVSSGGVFFPGLAALPDGGFAATLPPHDAGTYDVTLSMPDGGSSSLANALTFVAPPQLVSVTPSHGPATLGQTVTLGGAGFSAGSTVLIGGLSGAPVTVASESVLTARAAVHDAGVVDVTVTDLAGQTSTLIGGFTYDPPPSVTAIAPAFGPSAGGTAVTITGTNFVSGASVTIGGVAATSVQVTSPTSLTAVTGLHSAASTVAEAVVVTTPDGQKSVAFPGYRYWRPAVVTSMTPSFGPEAGGTSVTLAGAGFRTGMTATLDGTPVVGLTLSAQSAPVLDSLSATFTTPPHAAGPAALVLTNLDGQTTTAAPFLYAVQPFLTGVAPIAGPVSGGTDVALLGAGFIADAGVFFAGVGATSVWFDGGVLFARTPVHAAGAVSVQVNNPGGLTSSLSAAFLYANPPTVTAVAPATGLSVGDAGVTVSGTNFAPGARVFFGGAEASGVTYLSSSSLSCTTPAHPGGGAVDVIVNVGGVPGALANGYTYLAGPTLDFIEPVSGPPTGGTTLTLRGQNFASGATVTLGGALATSVVLVDAGVLTAVSPAHAAGSVDVTVTNPDGQGITRTQFFTFTVPLPAPKTISPTSGPSTGGTPLIILGADFDATSTVQLGGVAATGVTLVSTTTLTATAPAHVGSPDPVDLVVTTQGGQGTLAKAFTFIPGPKLVRVDPAQGPLAGGTPVTLLGTNFQPGAVVTLGSDAGVVEGLSLERISSTSLRFVTPPHAQGRVDVVVTNPDGQPDVLSGGYEYVEPPEGLVARSRYAFGCGAVPGEGALAAVVVALALRRRRQGARGG